MIYKNRFIIVRADSCAVVKPGLHEIFGHVNGTDSILGFWVKNFEGHTGEELLQHYRLDVAGYNINLEDRYTYVSYISNAGIKIICDCCYDEIKI